MRCYHPHSFFFLFFFNDTATTEIYTLSLHDALPISPPFHTQPTSRRTTIDDLTWSVRDRKSTRLNSSHVKISYAVFCLKKKKNKTPRTQPPHIQTHLHTHERATPHCQTPHDHLEAPA